MSIGSSGIRVEGLTEFRSAAKAALGRAPRELTAGLKRAGAIPIKEAASRVPQRTGALAASFKAQVRGTTGDITSGVPYGAGAEWGSHGRWLGFDGSPPRYVWPAVESRAREIEDAVLDELREVVTILGWAHGTV